MIISFSGHRNINNVIITKVYNDLEAKIKELKPNKCISGMAVGFDLLAAKVCCDIGIPFIAAVPFINQEQFYPQKDVILYHKLLKQAEKVEIISEGGFANYKYQKRNEWMCDNSDALICYLCHVSHTLPSENDGEKSTPLKSGTLNTVNYMKTLDKPIYNIF